jgi:hypothetical protein
MAIWGKRFSVRAASIPELNDGKVKIEPDYCKAKTILQQVGSGN